MISQKEKTLKTVGEYIIHVTGKDKYAGIALKTIRIVPKKLLFQR